MPFSKNHIRVTVPRRSGFDKSHRNSGTLTCGTITPILCDEVIPGTRCHLKLNLATQLPPLASDTYMNLKLKAEAFFVPMRLCCGSFESFFSDFGQPGLDGYYHEAASGNNGYIYTDSVKGAIPKILTDFGADEDFSPYFGPGSLIDYLGCRLTDTAVKEGLAINPMPLVAYALVYQEWYRNPRVQKPLFVRLFAQDDDATELNANLPIATMPFTFYRYGEGGTVPTFFANLTNLTASPTGVIERGSFVLADGSTIFDLRQRNFGLDYFTGARVDAQQGAAAAVVIPVSGDDAGKMTIAQLRAANSLQQFRERNNLPSPRMVDQVKARYGANLSDGVAQRPICIGSASYDVASTGISQTGGSDVTTENPFNGIAAQYGRAYGAGSDFIINDFVANEPGYILVNISLVPEVTYATGIDRMFTRYRSQGDIVQMATPLLQNVGDQAVFTEELVSTPTFGKIFGFQDRYADFMFKPNSCHGLMRDGSSLSSFVLQRSFDGDAELSSEFLQIPKDYLDPVMAVTEAVSGLSAWYDCMLDWKVSMPLAEFSIPSLQDPAYEHGQSVSLRRNGQIF